MVLLCSCSRGDSKWGFCDVMYRPRGDDASVISSYLRCIQCLVNTYNLSLKSVLIFLTTNHHKNGLSSQIAVCVDSSVVKPSIVIVTVISWSSFRFEDHHYDTKTTG
eukprot:260596_1